jgi:hypothetical protein
MEGEQKKVPQTGHGKDRASLIFERRSSMKRIAALSVILVLVLSGSALAMGKTHEATITMVHNDQNMMMVKDKSGKETEVYWTAETKLLGKPMAEGETVHYKAKMKDGKLTAYWVHVGEMTKEKAPEKKPAY